MITWTYVLIKPFGIDFNVDDKDKSQVSKEPSKRKYDT